MKLTVTITAKTGMIPEETLKQILIDLMANGEPLPAEIVKQLRASGRATYKTPWVHAEYELK